MKIRNGFVSNSSSSSFIIRVSDEFPTVKSAAEYIIGCCDNETETELENLNTLSNPDLPVFFNTWGDDTYIRKDGNFIIIQTSQNLDVDRLYENCITKKELPEGFGDKYNYIDDDYDESYKEDIDDYTHTFDNPQEFNYYYHNFRDFVILQYGEGIKGITGYIDNCPNCGRFNKMYKMQNGQNICFCQMDKYIQKFERKEKINKINENS
jgi:hypothetical protein